MITIINASSDAWSFRGFLAAAIGLSVIALLRQVGIAHGLAAVFPWFFEAWADKPTDHTDRVSMFFSDRLNDLYLVLGWAVLTGILALIVGPLIIYYIKA